MDFGEHLLGCCDDPCTFIVAGFVPGGICWIQSKAVDGATGLGKGIPYCLICSLGIIGAVINRATIRKKYGMQSDLCIYCMDCLKWALCAPCAASQEYREVAARGSSNKAIDLQQY
jgi:Cys-rich protein (TIGR01571 family)